MLYTIDDFKDYISMPIPDTIQDLFLLDTVQDFRENKLDHYLYNDSFGVPRVSEVLKECISKEYLVNWAARIGYDNAMKERRKATTIGSHVHTMIENYLLKGTDLDLSYKVPLSYLENINISYNNFKYWVSRLNHLGYNIEKVISTEETVICPYYGGTIDCIMQINGKIYIVDFKTSKSISYEYIMQTCAYLWMVNNGYCKSTSHVDGIGIIRVDKENPATCDDLFLNLHIPQQNYIIGQYISGFTSLLSSYYHLIDMRKLYSSYKKDYNISKTI